MGAGPGSERVRGPPVFPYGKEMIFYKKGVRPVGPTISVVVPVWDGEALLGPLVEMLERAAEGLASGEWECILVDDGSSDGTWAEASRLAEARPWLRPHRAPHAGLGAARNLGASLARGESVWFVDADDGVALGALARVAGRMREDAC